MIDSFAKRLADAQETPSVLTDAAASGGISLELALAIEMAKAHIFSIAELFVDDAKITLIVRLPDDTEADVVISSDTLASAREVLRRRAVLLGEQP